MSASRKSLPWTLREGQEFGPTSARPRWVSKGEDVEAIQRGLDIEVTGAYDEATRRAVVAYQRDRKLLPTGTVDRKLFTRLTRGQG